MTDKKTIALAKRIIGHRDKRLGFSIKELKDNTIGMYYDYKIVINSKFVEKLNYKTMKHVILHEVAHSLVGGHGKEFNKICKELGCLADGRTLKLL